MSLPGIAQMCEDHGFVTDSCNKDKILALVETMVSRQPLREGNPSPSHLMWLARETTKLITRHAELELREKNVSMRELAAAIEF